jgi:hypothetical protein
MERKEFHDEGDGDRKGEGKTKKGGGEYKIMCTTGSVCKNMDAQKVDNYSHKEASQLPVDIARKRISYGASYFSF